MLHRALDIAEIRNPGKDDGTVARILWKLSQVLRDISLKNDLDITEAEDMKLKALFIRRRLLGGQRWKTMKRTIICMTIWSVPMTFSFHYSSDSFGITGYSTGLAF